MNLKGIGKDLGQFVHSLNQFMQSKELHNLLATLGQTMEQMEQSANTLNSLLSQADRQDLAHDVKNLVAKAALLVDTAQIQLVDMKLPQSGQKAANLITNLEESSVVLITDLQFMADSLRRASENLERLAARLEATPSEILFSKPPNSDSFEPTTDGGQP